MKLKTILFNVALTTLATCSVGTIAASQVSDSASKPTEQEASQQTQLDQQALAWVKKLSEATATQQELEDAAKFHQENLETLSPERFQELNKAIRAKESEFEKRVLRDASLMSLTIEARRIPYVPLEGSWLNATTQPAKTIKFVNTPDLVALIAHVTGKKKTEIESCLKPCLSNEQHNVLCVYEAQYWALSLLSELDNFEEPTVDILKKSSVKFRHTNHKKFNIPGLDLYKSCLEGLTKTKNEVQQFSYDDWLKAVALYYFEESDFLLPYLCSDKVFLTQQNQTISLAQWMRENIRLSEEQKQKLLKAERAAVQERQEQEEKAREQARREKEEKAEREALSEAQMQSQPQIQLDAPAPMTEQQSPDLLPETREQADALSSLGQPLLETTSATSSAEQTTKGGIGEFLDEHFRTHPEEYERYQENQRAYEREKNSVCFKIKYFAYRHPWITYAVGAIIGAAAIYGGYRLYKYADMGKIFTARKLAKLVGSKA